MRIPFLRQSTREFLAEGRRLGLTRLERLHGYVYARWPYHYIGLAQGRHKLLAILLLPVIWLLNRHSPFQPAPDARPGDPAQKRPSFADTYHGKAMPLAEAKKLVRLVALDRPVRTEVSEQVLPYTRARRIVLANPERIVLLDCPCRSAKEHPCLPLDVCIIIGDPLAAFLLEHHPGRCRQVDADEACAVLEAESRRGHVAHAFFKDVMLQRFYAICNCCACCCGAMSAQRHGVGMLCSSGYLAEVDPAACKGCGACVRRCQFQAVSLRDGAAAIDTARCMGCGVCVEGCPEQAVTLRPAPEKGEPLRVERL
ncbi:MAG: ATP-binding protein [Desulfovibrionaceae bacterium]